MTKFILTAVSALFAAQAFAGPVNINTADAATLAKELNGVGTVVSQRIVADRDTNGAFGTPAELARVSGVGPRTIEKNAEFILVE